MADSVTGTKVTTAHLRKVADDVERVIGQYKATVSNLYEINNALDQMWDGDSSEDFKSQIHKDHANFNAMTDLLVKYVETLRKNADFYEKAEADVKDIIKTNKIRKSR